MSDKKRKYYIWTEGCQMNKAESERLGSCLEKLGYQATTRTEEADTIILNSCVVRQSAENKVVSRIHSLKTLKKARPDVTLAVTGCLVDSNIDQLKRDFPHVDYFFRPGDYTRWLGKPEPLPIPACPSASVFVPVIQGCNNFCTYCIVPYRRGREVSRPVAEVVCEVRELVRRNTREVTLLGQNVDSYGHDLPGKPDLADLLAELNAIDGLARIRFLTNHPKDMSPKLIDAIACLNKVCKHINLPVQAGDDAILKAMRRGYTVEHYRQLIAGIRRKVPGVALSTDVIVGFPSETEEQFQHTVDLLSEIRFDTVHVAAYSPRQGTIAARELKDDVSGTEKQKRLEIVEKLQERIAGEINRALLDHTMEVLVEGDKGGKWFGRTRSNKLVFFSTDGGYAGGLVNIKIEKTTPWSLQGIISDVLA